MVLTAGGLYAVTKAVNLHAQVNLDVPCITDIDTWWSQQVRIVHHRMAVPGGSTVLLPL